jgi:hypothetical protein
MPTTLSPQSLVQFSKTPLKRTDPSSSYRPCDMRPCPQECDFDPQDPEGDFECNGLLKFLSNEQEVGA